MEEGFCQGFLYLQLTLGVRRGSTWNTNVRARRALRHVEVEAGVCVCEACS